MKKEYDFSKAKRGPVISNKGKTRITMWVDTDILEAFREKASKEETGYQTLMNSALRDGVFASEFSPLEVLRKMFGAVDDAMIKSALSLADKQSSTTITILQDSKARLEAQIEEIKTKAKIA
jgi:hypothetical protein